MKTRFMIIMAAMAFVFTSCGNNNGTSNAEQVQEAPVALEIDQVLASADTLANQEITMEGICTHTCKHGATKIFMMGSDDTKTIRVEAASLGSFDQKCINSIVMSYFQENTSFFCGIKHTIFLKIFVNTVPCVNVIVSVF